MTLSSPLAADRPDQIFALRHDPRYHVLGDAFFTALAPDRLGTSPVLVHANARAAALIGLPERALGDPRFAAIFSGQTPLEGFQPLAMVYSGHQFGQWAGQLGDGRALTIGQVRNADDGFWDIQLKGAGKTPYSRFGDGRAVLRSSIREYLCSEAMAALGVPTTRALSVVATRSPVLRETVEPGAVVTRLMRSNIRFGHFEHFHHRGEPDRVRELAEFVIATYHPELDGLADRHRLWFDSVVTRTAHMVADWQAIGFAHGVMNTDNMSILGDTIDYGPFGFLDTFDPGFICNHSDHTGRYAFDRQPAIALWNLQALAVAVQGLVAWDDINAALQSFVERFVARYAALMRAKIGLAAEEDSELVTDLLALMRRGGADYSLTFRLLSTTDGNPGRARWTALFSDAARPAAFRWLDRWQARIGEVNPDFGAARTQMDARNPKFVLRNWVAESAIRAVEDHGDVATLDRIFRLVTAPFAEHALADAVFAAPPPEAMRDLEVSCSS
jgi:uncharacterized protein YdiU (UPF0061 family)